jgi:hypothetical protein
MAIGPEQQIFDTRVQFTNPFQVERGGILSLATLSGIQYAVYEPNPDSNTVPLGMQQHDQEEVDLSRAVVPWNTHRAYPPFTSYPYIILGVVVTNAIHPHVDPNAIRPGAPAYLAPSGLITANTTWSSKRIGTFDSSLNDPTIKVPGAQGATSSMRVGGVEYIVNPEPVIIPTAGWCRIRLNIR